MYKNIFMRSQIYPVHLNGEHLMCHFNFSYLYWGFGVVFSPDISFVEMRTELRLLWTGIQSHYVLQAEITDDSRVKTQVEDWCKTDRSRQPASQPASQPARQTDSQTGSWSDALLTGSWRISILLPKLVLVEVKVFIEMDSWVLHSLSASVKVSGECTSRWVTKDGCRVTNECTQVSSTAVHAS